VTRLADGGVGNTSDSDRRTQRVSAKNTYVIMTGLCQPFPERDLRVLPVGVAHGRPVRRRLRGRVALHRIDLVGLHPVFSRRTFTSRIVRSSRASGRFRSSNPRSAYLCSPTLLLALEGCRLEPYPEAQTIPGFVLVLQPRTSRERASTEPE
jgi:hypothetical protein